MSAFEEVQSGPAGEAAREDPAQAARERQSHVRHELRAPLAVIYPLLSLFISGATGELSPQQREHLVVLQRNVERLDALVTSVVESGWADCSAAPTDRAEILPMDLVDGIIALRRAQGQDRPAVVVQRDARPAPRARADSDDVLQIVKALIRNATTYTPSTGQVSVRITDEAEPGWLALEVADTGPGMSPGELGQACDFGFRGEAAARLQTPGLGIGLWVCRRLAERNGGGLTLANGPDTGLRATLMLPSAAASPREPV